MKLYQWIMWKIEKRRRCKAGTFEFIFEHHEMLVLRRYVKLTDDPTVPNVETLLTGMISQQVDFIIECLAENDTVVDKLYPEVCGEGPGGV